MFKVTYKKTGTSVNFFKWFKTESQAKIFAKALGDRCISVVLV